MPLKTPTSCSHPSSRVWLVTGSSSGLGRYLVEHLLTIGERVVATLRKSAVLAPLTEKYATSQLLLLPLDVTDEAQMKAVFEATRTQFGQLDVVVNNAGYGMLGEFETFPEEVGRHLMEVLFWGPARISREAIKFMRDINQPGQGGRILNVTSMGGFIGYPTGSYYHAGKFALEGLTESYSKELLPEWNINVTIIEPGGFRTKFTEGSMVRTPIPPQYNQPHAPAMLMRQMINQPLVGDPAKAAKAIVRVADMPDPPIRIQLGTESVSAVKWKAGQTIRDAEKYDELAHSTNADDIDKDMISKNFAQANQ